MVKINTAIFPIGGLGTRFLPATKAMPKEMLPIVAKPLIQYVVEEARACGIERLVFVTGRQKHAVENHFDHMVELETELERRNKDEALSAVKSMLGKPGEIIFIRQMRPLGLGHAVWSARHIIRDDPFAVLLADDFISSEIPCLHQMMSAYKHKPGNYLACAEVEPDQVSSYGILDPDELADGSTIKMKGLLEKPSIENAPSNIAVVGRYILQPEIIKTLEATMPGVGAEVQLTDAISADIAKTPTFGFKFEGVRYDCGSQKGFIEANNYVYNSTLSPDQR